MQIIDITGRRFGRLLVLERSVYRNKHNQALWECECDCGNTSFVYVGSLRAGYTKSCGCLQREVSAQRNGKHRMCETPTYGPWRAMRRRCSEPQHVSWHRYGGRGISVCEEWQDFETFLADMGLRPDGMTLDRIDNDGNYEPANCRWSTPYEQIHNRGK